MPTCQKAFTLTVEQALDPVAWWKMEEADADPRIDAVNGIDLSYLTGTVDDGPGKIDLGLELESFGPPGDFYNSWMINFGSADLGYTGNGFTVCMWGMWDIVLPNFRTSIFHYSSGPWRIDVYVNSTGIEVNFQDDGADVVTVPFVAVSGQFYFFRVWLDPDDGLLGIQVDDGAITRGTVVLNPTPDASGVFWILTASELSTNAANHRFTADEVAVFLSSITDSQASFLYNGGAGKTYPL